MLSRRRFLQGTAVVTLLGYAGALRADAAPIPIVFVHGDSDYAATWETMIWRFESNGYPRDRLFAISFTDPQARDDNTAAQPNRSSTDDELKELSAFIDKVLKQTGAEKFAIVALIPRRIFDAELHRQRRRSPCRQGGAGRHAQSWRVRDRCAARQRIQRQGRRSCRNSTAARRKSPMASPSSRCAATAMISTRSPTAPIIGFAGMPTGVDVGRPELKGATNLVLDRVDHRETALSPRAFEEIYAFITGAAPSRIAIVPESEVTLNGRVTGVVGGTTTNRPIEGAKVEVYATDPDTGARKGAALLTKTVGADGVWGPLKTDSATTLEFVSRGRRAADDPYLPFADPALVRRVRLAAVDRRAGRRRRSRRSDETAARLFRPAARHRPD